MCGAVLVFRRSFHGTVVFRNCAAASPSPLSLHSSPSASIHSKTIVDEAAATVQRELDCVKNVQSGITLRSQRMANLTNSMTSILDIQQDQAKEQRLAEEERKLQASRDHRAAGFKKLGLDLGRAELMMGKALQVLRGAASPPSFLGTLGS